MDEKLKKKIKKWAVSALTVIAIIILMAVVTSLSGKDNEGSSSGGDTVAENSVTKPADPSATEPAELQYEFRSEKQLNDHFDKHGGEFDYASAEEYLAGANRVISDPEALHKTEAEDGDYVYYLEDSNEFVILSVDGYIRTYFKPSAGIDYYNRQ